VVTFYGTGGGSFISEAVLKFEASSEGNPGPAGAGAVLLARSAKSLARGPPRHGGDPKIESYTEVIATSWCGFGWATETEAQYGGLILGLQLALNCGVTSLRVVGTSALLHRQMTGQCRVKAERLQPLHQLATDLFADMRLDRPRLEQVARHRNVEPERLAEIALENPALAYNDPHAFVKSGKCAPMLASSRPAL